jgi:hypothetical protein
MLNSPKKVENSLCGWRDCNFKHTTTRQADQEGWWNHESVEGIRIMRIK